MPVNFVELEFLFMTYIKDMLKVVHTKNTNTWNTDLTTAGCGGLCLKCSDQHELQMWEFWPPVSQAARSETFALHDV